MRLKVAGGFLAILGIGMAIGAVGGSSGMTQGETAWNVGIAVALAAIGGGLCFDWRWAWLASMVVALLAVGSGFWVLGQPGNLAEPGAPLVVMVILVVPGLLLCLALLTPASLRWVRHRQ
jgi:hypothetical protein